MRGENPGDEYYSAPLPFMKGPLHTLEDAVRFPASGLPKVDAGVDGAERVKLVLKDTTDEIAAAVAK